MTTLHALIAEDEPLLAQALRAELARAWPELVIAATVGDGLSAVQETLRLRPDVVFFDIRMPALSGLDAAAEVMAQWPRHTPAPALVFVTAYDEYAVKAFEAQAVDYLLKPVQSARLDQTVTRLRALLSPPMRPAPLTAAQAEQLVTQLRRLISPAQHTPSTPPHPARQSLAGGTADEGADLSADVGAGALRVIQASLAGSQTLHLVPVEDVLYFEAADKYVRVVTPAQDYLIRTPLRELVPRLDPQAFWQIHRGTLVRASAIATVRRDPSGRLSLTLRHHPDVLAVSRLHAHRFKAM